MSQPNLPELVTVNLDAGTHWICTCGASQNFPHCDGSHKGSEFKPRQLDLPTPQAVELAKPHQS